MKTSTASRGRRRQPCQIVDICGRCRATRRNIGGWTVRDLAGHRYTIPAGYRIGAGGYVRLHTGRGTNRSGDLYWRRGWYVWNNDGDRATLKNGRGTVIDRCRHRGGGSSVGC